MKAFLTSCDLRLGLNPMVSRTLLAIPGVNIQTTLSTNTDVVFLSWIAAPELFQQDSAMLRSIVDSKKPVIIFDHMETAKDNFLLGWDNPPGNVYDELHAAVSLMNVHAYFKRELLTNWTSAWRAPKYPIYPLDWVLQTNGEKHGPVSREEFEARPIDVFYVWGYSSESRPRLMGELLKQAGRFSAHFCLTEEDLNRALKEKQERIFALLHTPHYRRIHIDKLLDWQAQSKVSISMRGAGRKCFRDSEASFNCVMARQEPSEVQWAYPWIPAENCIGLSNNEVESVELLHTWLRINQGSLHPLYLAGVQNNERYHSDNYARNYLLPKIKEVLK